MLFAWFVRCKKLELNLLPISLIAGSVAKWGVMTLLIIRWVLPSFGKGLSHVAYKAATVTYSTTQLIAACLELHLACGYLAYCAIKCKTFKIKIVYG